MTYDRYYYSILSPAEKRAYRVLYDAMENFCTSASVEAGVDVLKVFEYIELDNPHLFYVDFTEYRYRSYPDRTEIEMTLWYTKAEAKEIKQKIDRVLYRMLALVNGNTDAEKIRSVHDLMVEHVVYDDRALEDIERHFPRSNTLMGVLFFKSAVCEGIAKAIKMLLNILDIKCIVAAGYGKTEDEPHAWNIIKLDGKTYHLDATWDIALSLKDNFSYKYYLISDGAISADHRFDKIYPECKETYI